MASPSTDTPSAETPADPQPSTAAPISAQPPSNDLELMPAREPSSSALAHLRPVLPEHTLSYSAPPSLIDPRHVRADASGLSAGAYTPLCPSARTSYTRVDGTATPRVPGDHDDEHLDESDGDGGEGDGVQGEDNEQGEAASQEVATQEQVPQIPQVTLTFLLVSGRRRTMSFEPETTVGRVKELVWNAWPNDWQDERPPAPSYLRILYLGKILQDDDTLQQLNFPVHTPVLASPTPPLPAASIPATPVASTAVSPAPDAHTAPAPTIVHLSIRAYAPPAEDAPKKRRLRASSAARGEGAQDGEGAGCCGCVVM